MTIILKLGGSLLTLPELAGRIHEVLNQRFGQNCLVIPGGGATADLVREWSQIYRLDDEAAHWLAIESLDFNNRLLRNVFEWKSVSSREEARLHWNNQTSPLLLEMETFVSAEELRVVPDTEFQSDQRKLTRSEIEGNSENFRRLPHDWNTTSDSLAAWTAIRWPASELVLLKSIPAPLGLSAKQASDMSLVDAFFPQLSDQVPLISWCNLRATPVVVETWLTRNAEEND